MANTALPFPSPLLKRTCNSSKIGKKPVQMDFQPWEDKNIPEVLLTAGQTLGHTCFANQSPPSHSRVGLSFSWMWALAEAGTQSAAEVEDVGRQKRYQAATLTWALGLTIRKESHASFHLR